VRNLLIFLLALVGIWWLRRTLRRLGEGRDAAAGEPGRRAGQDRAEALPEQMRECAHCGVHVPETEGVRDQTGFYCSEAHRRAGPRLNG
jgi:uncharacterized protein